ncbi:MAG: hypothetical protein IJ720_03905 [Clostridia bacterium]|nr:hypothetical protein [Clostridia bacterium]
MAHNYPFVLIHGYNNMDETFAPARRILTEAGYECYSPHIGPFTGVWDRACELYAMLKGGTVDYGLAHSQRCDHGRYGRTYDAPLFARWGEKDEVGDTVKANFIGHSFGGPTIRTLLKLLKEGDEREREATPEGQLSPLFEGGHEDWINSVTTLAAPHNGTTVLSMAGGYVYTSYFMEFSKANLNSGTTKDNADKYDLDRFGFTSDKLRLRYAPDKIRAYLRRKEDNCFYELTPSGTDRLMGDYHTYDDVYYFSIAAVCTTPILGGEAQWPTDATVERHRSSAIIMGSMHSKYYGPEWRPNDGRVPLASARAPKNEPQQDFDLGEGFSYRGPIEKGVWNIFPVEEPRDHNFYIGEEVEPEVYKQYMLDLAAFIAQTNEQ